MSDVTTTDYTTDPPTITQRNFTPEEIAQQKTDMESRKKHETEQLVQAKQLAEATAAAIAHAKSLGFTDQMVSCMYPNLGA